jgi:prophage regulatory protein
MGIDRILRSREVTHVTATSRATRWRMVKAGRFPAPVQLGDRSIGWRESDIVAWLQNRPTSGVVTSALSDQR